MSVSVLAKTFKKSGLLSIISLLPGLVLGVSVAINRINSVFPDKDAFFSNKDYFQTVSLFRPIIDLYRDLLGLIPDNFEQKLLYGLVGCLFLIVFWVHVVILNPSFSWRGFSWRRFWHENHIFTVVRIAEYFLVSLIAIVLLGKYLLYYSFPLAILIPNLVFWHLWHDKGIWGNFDVFDYGKGKNLSPWKFYKNMSLSVIVSITLRSLLFSLLLLFIPVVAEEILDKPQLLVNYLLSYRTWFSVFNHAYFDIFAFSLSVFSLPILYVLAHKNQNKKMFYGKIVVPFMLGVIFGLMYVDYRVFFIDRFDINKSAFKLAQFQTNANVDRQLIIFKGGSPEIRPFKAEVNMRSIDLERKVSDLPGDPRLVVQKVPCTDANKKAAVEFYIKASAKFFESALIEAYLTYSSGKGGFGIVYGCSLFDFDIKTILNDKLQASRKSTDGLSLSSILGFSGKLASPLNRLISVSEKSAKPLFSEGTYDFDSAVWNFYGYQLLADWFYYNGDVDRAKKYYRKALDIKKDNQALEEDLNIGVRSLQDLDKLKPLFSQGAISGSVSYEGDMKNIKVAILAEEDKVNFSGRGIKSLKVGNYAFLDGYSLMASSQLSSTGEFAFENVMKGDYYLAIMIINGEKIEVLMSKPIQKITVDNEQSIFDTGMIIIQNAKFKM